jgi:hypothetical protein
MFTAKKNTGLKSGIFLLAECLFQLKVIASHGHSPTHAPQSTQSPSLTTATPLSMEIASVGQTPTQVSQPVQVSLSILAAIFLTPGYKL